MNIIVTISSHQITMFTVIAIGSLVVWGLMEWGFPKNKH